jgi:hypothetical protein
MVGFGTIDVAEASGTKTNYLNSGNLAVEKPVAGATFLVSPALTSACISLKKRWLPN